MPLPKLDDCSRKRCFWRRTKPATAAFMRACWNSWIAPHNFEGFFLNFGDMLARANDLPNARAMYEAARLPKSYAQWPYRDVLERRLARLEQ